MILIEKIRWLIHNVARFFVWFITARDCEHCTHYKYYLFQVRECDRGINDKLDCKSTVTRRHFERKKNK